MRELRFAVTDARPDAQGSEPAIVLGLRVQARSDVHVHGILLRSQVFVEAHERSYSEREALGLVDLFGARSRWNVTLRRLPWASAPVLTSGFRESTSVSLKLPCPLAADCGVGKYLLALEHGEVPLTIGFGGTAFFGDGERVLVASPIPWSAETRFSLPLAVLHELRAQAGLHAVALGTSTFERLAAFKSERGLATWDAAIASLLEQPGGRATGGLA